MSTPQRHIGRMARTDQRLIVVFMQIPDREDHALVVAADSLPPRFEQALMQVVQSPEGQNSQDLGTVLARRLMPDTNVSLLTTMHNAGMLQPVPVDNIVMFPLPNQPYPLRKVLESMGRLIQPAQQTLQNPYGDPLEAHTPYAVDLPMVDPNDPQFLTEQAPAADAAQTEVYAQTDRFNQHVQNQNVDANERNLGIAKNLLIEAQMLESEANRKREQAYAQAPSLRPAPPATTSRTMAPRRPTAETIAAEAKPKTARAKAAPKAAPKTETLKPSRAKAK